eukprot:COSAG05_NODE_1440_length_4882_cov_2.788208_4_plen_201_part_00
MQVGAKLLLVDEDTAATNFMIRSAAVQKLVAPDKEPITPFIAKVRALADRGPTAATEGAAGSGGVSSILVLGGSGDYFAVADTVICMDSYVPRDVTAEALEIAKEMLPPGTIQIDEVFGKPAPRVPDRGSIASDCRTKVPTKECILWGEDEIRLGAVEQLTEHGEPANQLNYLLPTRSSRPPLALGVCDAAFSLTVRCLG